MTFSPAAWRLTLSLPPSQVSAIIARDFFPELDKLEAQREYLEASERNDRAAMHRLRERFSSTAGSLAHQGGGDRPNRLALLPLGLWFRTVGFNSCRLGKAKILGEGEEDNFWPEGRAFLSTYFPRNLMIL